jgi:DNA repair photolyase
MTTRCKSAGVVRERKTKFIELFRTTPPKNVCPNFYVLSHANGCAFEPHCDYCYLKSTFWHKQGAEVFSNIDTMLDEVRKWIARDGLESTVLNSGNLSDSLVFERIRPMIPQLVDVFREAEAAGRPHALLFVTKGGREECRPIMKLKPCGNVIVSFSINNAEIAARYERGAAPTADRLAAARELREAGWRLRIRIDPMFLGADYRPLAAEVRKLAPERLTLGTLRAEPHLLHVAHEPMFDALEPATEPKALARYPLAARLELYRSVLDLLRDVCPAGLCEETRAVWETLGLDADAKSCNCGS